MFALRNPVIALLFASQLVATLACQSSDGSEGKIVGGVQSLERPEVVWIKVPGGGSCTGTFVAPNKVLTAGHCGKDESTGNPATYRRLPNNNPGHVVVYAGRELYVSEYINHSGYPEAASFLGLHHRDISILTVPDANAYEYARLVAAPPVAGMPVTLFGFGSTDYDSNSNVYAGNQLNGKFRGNNKIASLLSASASTTDPNAVPVELVNMIAIDGAKVTKAAGADPDRATTGPGDSGGPLFDARGALLGILSGALAFPDKITSLYVNLADPEVRRFIDNQIGTSGTPPGAPASVTPGSPGSGSGPGSPTAGPAPGGATTTSTATSMTSGSTTGGTMTMGEMVMDPATGLMCMGTVCMSPGTAPASGSGGPASCGGGSCTSTPAGSSVSCSNGVCTTAPAGSSVSQQTNADGTVTTCIDGSCSTR